jgi:hypothetical protein
MLLLLLLFEDTPPALSVPLSPSAASARVIRRSPDIDTVADVRMIELMAVNAVLDFSRINTA